MMELEKDFLRGSYPPLVTPFLRGEVDYATYEKLVHHQIDNGTHGILVTGTTGEPSTLSLEERAKLVETAVRASAGRVPVVAATGCESFSGTVELSRAAEKAGADALLVVTPYYIKPPQRGLVEYYAQLGKETQLPLMIYHIPGRTAVSVSIATMGELMKRVPTLVGVKHAVNDLAFVTEALAHFGPEFRVFVGLEALSFPMLCIGAAGLMNAVGNIAPRKVAELCNRVFQNDLKGARALHFALNALNEAVFLDTNPIPMKYMMMRMGLLPNEEHRLPMVGVTEVQAKELDAVLKDAGLVQ